MEDAPEPLVAAMEFASAPNRRGIKYIHPRPAGIISMSSLPENQDLPDQDREFLARIAPRLEEARSARDRCNRLLTDPATASDSRRYGRIARDFGRLDELVGTYCAFQKIISQIEENRELLEGDEQDPEFLQLVESDISSLREEKTALKERLETLLIPPDENDARNIIVEIRAGTGGEEAALFAADLFRMYSKYAERHGLQIASLDTTPAAQGGLKEMVFSVEGAGAYQMFKFESGVHRVQRVPETESQGRIHTSAATVAVLPEAEEVEVSIDPSELRIDRFCSSGPGGQSVNTTYSAIRITHIPTGLVVSCQDEKSQHKNKSSAMKVLRARLLEKKQAEQAAELSEQRKKQVKTGDRSDKIRTYNYPQNRVTDHRINFSLHRLESVIDGDIDELVDKLHTWDRDLKLEQLAGGDEE